MATVHMGEHSKSTRGICGFSHILGSFTQDPKKVTCPQCLREHLDRRAEDTRKSRRKNK